MSKPRFRLAALPVAALGNQQVVRLETHRIQRRLGDFRRAGVAGQAKHGAPRVSIPVGRAEPDKGRHQVDPLVGIRVLRQLTALRRGIDDPQPIAEPVRNWYSTSQT